MVGFLSPKTYSFLIEDIVWRFLRFSIWSFLMLSDEVHAVLKITLRNVYLEWFKVFSSKVDSCTYYISSKYFCVSCVKILKQSLVIFWDYYFEISILNLCFYFLILKCFLLFDAIVSGIVLISFQIVCWSCLFICSRILYI